MSKYSVEQVHTIWSLGRQWYVQTYLREFYGSQGG